MSADELELDDEDNFPPSLFAPDRRAPQTPANRSMPPPPPPLPPRTNDHAGGAPSRPSAAGMHGNSSMPRPIPGPAGAIDAFIEKRGLHGGFCAQDFVDSPLLSQHASKANMQVFQPSEAWSSLSKMVSDDGSRSNVHPHAAQRITLQDLLLHASVPPDLPPRPPLLCVIIKSIDTDGGGGEDYAAMLADETAEISATLHTHLFHQHPGSIVVGKRAFASLETASLARPTPTDDAILPPPCRRRTRSRGCSCTNAGAVGSSFDRASKVRKTCGGASLREPTFVRPVGGRRAGSCHPGVGNTFLAATKRTCSVASCGRARRTTRRCTRPPRCTPRSRG